MEDIKGTIKYYIPEVEEIRIGYECEIFYKKEWIPIILSKERIGNYSNYDIGDMSELDEMVYYANIKFNIRTSYLTREQIEAEGFELKHKSIDWWFEAREPFNNGFQNFFAYKSYGTYLNYGFHDQRIKIRADFGCEHSFEKADTLFEGECKSINELKTILKLIHYYE